MKYDLFWSGLAIALGGLAYILWDDWITARRSHRKGR